MQLKDYSNINQANFKNIQNILFETKYNNFYITQRFNDKDSTIKDYYRPRLGHDGLDFVVPNPASVKAFESGEVVYADWDVNMRRSNSGFLKNSGYFQGLGIMTIVWNKENNRLWVYGHLRNNLEINQGQQIKAGEHIGYMGGSGHGQLNAFPIHTHLGVYEVDGNTNILNFDNGFWGAIDPINILINLENQFDVHPVSYADIFKSDPFVLNRVLENQNFDKDKILVEKNIDLHLMVSNNDLAQILYTTINCRNELSKLQGDPIINYKIHTQKKITDVRDPIEKIVFDNQTINKPNLEQKLNQNNTWIIKSINP